VRLSWWGQDDYKIRWRGWGGGREREEEERERKRRKEETSKKLKQNKSQNKSCWSVQCAAAAAAMVLRSHSHDEEEGEKRREIERNKTGGGGGGRDPLRIIFEFLQERAEGRAGRRRGDRGGEDQDKKKMILWRAHLHSKWSPRRGWRSSGSIEVVEDVLGEVAWPRIESNRTSPQTEENFLRILLLELSQKKK
jgi:hypothetical protein